MRTSFLFFLMVLQFLSFSLEAMLTGCGKELAAEDVYNGPQSVMRVIAHFHEIQKKIKVLGNGLQLFDKSASFKVDIESVFAWLENAKNEIKKISEFRMQAEKKKAQFYNRRNKTTKHLIDDSTILQKSLVLKETLNALYDRALKLVKEAESREKRLHAPEKKEFRKLFKTMAWQAYFKTLSWILHDGAGKNNVVAFLIGARGYSYQEIPAFLKKIAREHPQLQIVIYSISNDIDGSPIDDINLQASNGSAHFFPQQITMDDIESVISDDLDQIEFNFWPLTLEQKATLLQLPIIYASPELPNIKLVSCCIELPVLLHKSGYQFFKDAFSEYINLKLNDGGVVFIGNNTQRYDLSRIPLIADIYYHFKHKVKHVNACNLQLYTQRADGQCIVYDPIELIDCPVMKFDDPEGNLFLPKQLMGTRCATAQFPQFLSENGLQYHLKSTDGKGLMITHVTSAQWEQPEIITSEGLPSRDPHHPEALKAVQDA